MAVGVIFLGVLQTQILKFYNVIFRIFNNVLALKTAFGITFGPVIFLQRAKKVPLGPGPYSRIFKTKFLNLVFFFFLNQI